MPFEKKPAMMPSRSLIMDMNRTNWVFEDDK